MYTLNSVEVHSIAYEEKDGVLVLNDQGGGVMSVSYDVAGTLRAQDHGHPPLIFDARGNGGGIIAPTITGDHQNRITDYTAIVVEYDSNSTKILECESDGN